MKLPVSIQWLWKGNSPAAHRTRQILKIVVFLTLLGLLFIFIDVKEVLRTLTSANPYYFLFGLFLSILVVFLNSIQLRLLTRKQGISFNVVQLFIINITIKFYLLFMPGSIVGSGMRWYKLSRDNGKTSQALAAVAFNRLLETSLVVLIGIAFWVLSGQDLMQFNLILLLLFVAGFALIWILLTRVSKPLAIWLTEYQQRKTTSSSWQKILQRITKFLLAVSTYALFSSWELFVIVFIAITYQLVGIASYFFLARAVSIDLTFIQLGWIRSVVLLAAILPISFAGGLGIREVTLVALMASYGIEVETALAFSLLLFARGLIIGLIGGLIEFVQTLRVKQSM